MQRRRLIVSLLWVIVALVIGPSLTSAQTNKRPILPAIPIVAPDQGIEPDLARFSGNWLGQWDGEFYTVITVKKVRADGIAEIEYRWQNQPRENYTLGPAKLAKIANGVLSFGVITLTIDSKDSTKAVGELVGRNKNGPIHRLSEFTKQKVAGDLGGDGAAAEGH